MIRPLIALLVVLLIAASAAPPAHSQQPANAEPSRGEGHISGREREPWHADKPSILHDIAINEAALQKAEAAHASGEDLARIYSNLGGLYEEAAMYPRSEDATRHAIALLGTGSQDRRAEELTHLGILHSVMNQPRDAEKELLEALHIRETLGDPIRLALTRGALAATYLKDHRYKQAFEPARQAYEVLGSNPAVAPTDRIAATEAFAFVLCGTHQCDRGIPFLRDAVQLSAATYGPDSLAVGVANFLLGHTYWQAGNMDQAADLMQRGTERMKVDMGWGNAVYVNAMSEYADFLRKRGQLEAASAAELEVKRTTTTVDVRSFAAR